MTLAFDTEAYFSAEFNIQTLGVKHYVSDPQADHYLISFWCPEWSYAGHPSQAPWDRVQGQTLVAHNAAYDLQVLQQIAPPLELEGIFDTAALAAYLQCPRDLKKAAQQLLGITVDKSVRDKMKGKHFHKLTPEQQEEVKRYCLKDAETSYWIWTKYGHLWPEHERALSQQTIDLSLSGVGIDEGALQEGIQKLGVELFECQKQIPWAGGETPVSSPKALAAECRRLGIEPPASTTKDSEEFEEWSGKYAEQIPMVKAIQTWRSINRTLEVLKAMDRRTFDGTLYYDLKYGGAPHTLRWAGSSGLNMQNLPKKEVCGVNIRNLLVPRNGNKLVVADFAQIEARVLLWLVGDNAMLERIRSGEDIYESHARATMGYDDPRPLKEVDPAKRQLAKVRVLQLGYGAGWKKFQASYVKETKGKTISDVEANRNVKDFRRKNPKIIALWNRLERGCRSSKGGTFELELPSGRVIRYFDVAELDGSLSGRVQRGGPRTNLYGGKFTENICQGISRDFLAAALLRLADAKYYVALHCHDEAVPEAPASEFQKVKQIMEEVPEWAEGCPVAVDAHACDFYEK